MLIKVLQACRLLPDQSAYMLVSKAATQRVSSTLGWVAAGCATVAEVRKRGDDFWGEFEFYLSDLVVGCVLACVLVGLLAPSAVIGARPKTKPSGE